MKKRAAVDVWTGVLCGIVYLQLARSAVLTVEFAEDEVRPPSGTDVYGYRFTPANGGPPKQITFVAENYTNPIVVPNVLPSTDYNVTVLDLINDLPLLEKKAVSGPDPPLAVQAVPRNATETSVSWKAPLRGGASRYRIQLLRRDESGNVTAGVPLDWKDQNIRISPLLPGGDYAVEVRSVLQSGSAKELVSDPIRIGFVQPPALPKSFRKVITNETSVTVQWEPAEGLVDSYYISIRALVQPNETWVYPGAGKLETSFGGLGPQTRYLLALSAMRGPNSSDPIFLNVTTKSLPPSDLKEVSAAPEPRSVELTWKRPNGVKGPVWYRISVNSTEIPAVNTTDASVKLVDLMPDTSYTVSVEALIENSDGTFLASRSAKRIIRTGSDPSVAVTAVVGAPELLLETADESIKFLEANATSEDNLVVNGDVSTGQRVYFRDLVGGTHYLIYAKLLQNGANVIRSFQKLTYPFPPLDMSANSSLVTTESVVLDWSQPSSTRFQGYQILYTKLDETGTSPANMSSFIVSNASATAYNVTGLAAGAKYAFRMKSLIDDVASVETPPVMQCTRPPKPENVTVKAMPVKLLLQLSRPLNMSTTNIKYKVQLVNLDKPNTPPRSFEFRNDSALVVSPVPIDFLGANYELRVATLVCDLLSNAVIVTISSLPPAVVFVRPPAEISQTSVKVITQSTWPLFRSMFDRYVFQAEGMPPQYYPPTAAKSQTIEFTGLTPGTKYAIYGWTERGEVQSDRKSIEVQLKPDNMSVLAATNISRHSISIEWNPPNGTVSQYEIGYNDTVPIFTNETAWMFTGLLAYRNYSVYVAAWSGTERSSAVTRFYQTLEDRPGKIAPEKIILKPLRPSKLVVRWALPDLPNGIITHYWVRYKEVKVGDWSSYKFPAANLSCLLPTTPGKTYQVKVAAGNAVDDGPDQDSTVTMPIGAPLLASASARPVKLDASQNTITMEFNKDFFLDNNGDVVKYAVIVAEDPAQNASSPLPSWKQVQQLPVWPPYQAGESFNPFDGDNNTFARLTNPDTGEAQVVIGSDKFCSSSNARYCNGPLKDNTRYFVKLRAFTSLAEDNVLYTDTAYTDAIPIEGPHSDTAAIAIGICIPIILLVFLACAVVLMRKYNWGPFVKRARKAVAKTADDKISIAESLPEKSRPVKLRDFAEHVRVMSADSDFKFSEEYEDLKHVGRDQACVAADLPANRPKNRFTNILPYDHSRVKLLQTDDEDGSDYINANYIPGQNSPREFIVTQGPLPGTRDDFWRMVWEQNCRAIVMLTRCVEKGRDKCDHYWPYDTDSVVYGDVDVTIMNESQTLDWTTREFRVARNNEPARSVRHFHFTAWPDFGVPERPQTLIKFVRAFREKFPVDTKPVVVHCSAGVGRSGTFIALDRLLQQIRVRDFVDIYGMVVEMRKERVWMVQTEQQYICIYQCLLCVLENREDEMGSMHSAMHENPCYEVSDDEGIVESGPF